MKKGIRYALSEVKDNYSSLNWWRNRVFIPYVIGTATRFHPRYPGYGNAVRVMEEDWDTLIVLDACRADYFQEVADLEQYDEYTTKISLGSHSSEWTRRNFADQEFDNTVYVSANPHTSLVAGDSFHEIFELWENDFDDDAGVVPPEIVRDSAIKAHEMYSNKRLIIHFMQPHGPFVGSDIKPPYEGECEYWRAYKQNLEHVLPFVDDIVDAIPGKTVVTADHGQVRSSGLKGHLGFGGHKPNLRLPGLVNVPWATIEDERRSIQSGEINEAGSERIEERLEQLGYL